MDNKETEKKMEWSIERDRAKRRAERKQNKPKSDTAGKNKTVRSSH